MPACRPAGHHKPYFYFKELDRHIMTGQCRHDRRHDMHCRHDSSHVPKGVLTCTFAADAGVTVPELAAGVLVGAFSLSAVRNMYAEMDS